jgi:hypothetical protein
MCEVSPFLPLILTDADDIDPMDRSSTSTRSRSIKESESLPFQFCFRFRGERLPIEAEYESRRMRRRDHGGRPLGRGKE